MNARAKRRSVTFVVVRGNDDNSSDHRRFYDACVIMALCADQLKGVLRMGAHSAMLTIPDIKGDARTFDDRVTDYVDIQKADTEGEVAEVVGRLKHRMGEAGVSSELIGKDLVIRHLERMYIPYDMWAEE